MNTRGTDRTGRLMARPLQIGCSRACAANAPRPFAQTQVPLDPAAATTRAAPAAGAATQGSGDATRPKPISLLSMDPSAPELSSLPAGVSPAFGSVSPRPGDWRLDYRGLLFVPLRVGFNTRLA